jgi:GNAT superfamily N-acetyltransferase
MITYQQESFNGFMEEAWDMLVAHWKEVGVFKKKMEFFPDADMYENLERLGMLKLYTARHDGVLIGYNAFVVQRHPHYITTLAAMNDILYVKPDYRKGSIAIKLMSFSEKALKQEGVKLVMMRSKRLHDFSTILKRKGYTEVETVYGKYLED